MSSHQGMAVGYRDAAYHPRQGIREGGSGSSRHEWIYGRVGQISG